MTELHPCAGCVLPQQFEVVAESCAPIERHIERYLSYMTSQSDSVVTRVEFSDVMIASGVSMPSAEVMQKIAVVKEGVRAIADIMLQANITFEIMQSKVQPESTEAGGEQCLVDGICTRVPVLFSYREELYGLKAHVEEQTRAEFSKIHTVQ